MEKKHQNAVNWVGINLAIKKRLTFYQTRSNTTILQKTLPPYCIRKIVGRERGNPLSKMTWMNNVQDERKTSRSQEIDVNSFYEKQIFSERTERPVIETNLIQTRSSKNKMFSNIEKAHERTKRLVDGINTENVPNNSSQTRSVYESNVQRWRSNTSWENGKIRCWSWWRESWANNAQRGGHGLPNSRTTTLCCETYAEYQRSRIDSENWEPSRSICFSTRPTTESMI